MNLYLVTKLNNANDSLLIRADNASLALKKLLAMHKNPVGFKNEATTGDEKISSTFITDDNDKYKVQLIIL